MDNSIKILAIENDEFIKIFLKDVFWIHGDKNNFDFAVVDNYKKAEGCIADLKTKPHLIFLDLFLPSPPQDKRAIVDESGFSFLEKIKSDPKTKNIKVIVFSPYGEETIKSRALKLGADKFLVKGDLLPEEIIKISEDLAVNNQNAENNAS